MPWQFQKPKWEIYTGTTPFGNELYYKISDMSIKTLAPTGLFFQASNKELTYGATIISKITLPPTFMLQVLEEATINNK